MTVQKGEGGGWVLADKDREFAALRMTAEKGKAAGGGTNTGFMASLNLRAVVAEEAHEARGCQIRDQEAVAIAGNFAGGEPPASGCSLHRGRPVCRSPVPCQEEAGQRRLL
jgi:hypothetical protein